MRIDARIHYGANAVRAGSPDYAENDHETNLVDALANILHWADCYNVEVDDALRIARMHHETERAEEDEEAA